MTIQKIENKYWIIQNGQPTREATEREVKRFMVKNLIDKLQTGKTAVLMNAAVRLPGSKASLP